MKAKLLMTIAAATMILAGCSNDENEMTDHWNGEIRLSSGVSVQQTRANSGDVPDKQIAAGQQIGIYVSGVPGEAVEYGYANISAKADGSGNFSDYSTSMYYPQSGNKVNIAAYHPYKVEAGNEYDFTVASIQSDAANYYASDLLYSTSAEFVRQKDAHSLTFKHLLSKITCTLQAGEGVSSVAGATVAICQVETAVKFNRTTGAVSTAQTPSKRDVTPGTYGAIIAPQTVPTSTQLLKVTLSNGGVFYYKTEEQTTFAGGSKYAYTITVKASGLTVKSTIDPWTAISKTGDAVME